MSEDGIIGFTAVFMGLLVVLIPIAGLTLRFAVKPILEPVVKSIRELREGQVVNQEHERRLLLMEEELDEVRQGVRTLLEAHRFDRQLTDSGEAKES